MATLTGRRWLSAEMLYQGGRSKCNCHSPRPVPRTSAKVTSAISDAIASNSSSNSSNGIPASIAATQKVARAATDGPVPESAALQAATALSYESPPPIHLASSNLSASWLSRTDICSPSSLMTTSRSKAGFG